MVVARSLERQRTDDLALSCSALMIGQEHGRTVGVGGRFAANPCVWRTRTRRHSKLAESLGREGHAITAAFGIS